LGNLIYHKQHANACKYWPDMKAVVYNTMQEEIGWAITNVWCKSDTVQSLWALLISLFILTRTVT